ncbi:SAVED domain-containing protein [Acidovorax sp. ACV01]|uniref:SAVED domain-containing protein n=1 Tax=Acidovorax sp. ACV01 TaxID=2769311 RepID=UPI0017808FB0|nr:SAVED domain-containing protein [Acidovorax sp. ACV01]MBD9395351.1 SAVED domain-containing protein [Acidovorax sp. ACV01]
MTQAVNTPRYGNAFQARIFWTYATRLLSSTTAVRRVGFESGPRGFDDVWVEYDPSRGPLDQFGRRLQVERFQCKWHVGNGTFTHVDLTDPKYSGATTTSLLQRARDAYLSDQADGFASRIRLMTNHRIHLDDVLHKLVEQQHHTLKLDEFFQGSTKQSKYWVAREAWRQHLKVDEAELRAFCERLALTSVSESLDDFRQRMDEALHFYGLKPSEPGTSSTIYDQLPYDWLAQGRNEFDAKSFREACGDDKLFADQAPPPAKVFGVKSFEHGFDRLEARCDEVLSLLPEFSDRYLKPEFTWEKDLLPKLTAFVRSAGQREQRLRLAMDTHLTLAFAAGTVLDTKSGKIVEIEQRTRGGSAIWAADDAPVDANWPGWTFSEFDMGTNGPEVAVAVSITRTTEQQVRAFLQGQPNIGRLVVAGLTGSASQCAVLNGTHADQLADRLANHLKDVRSIAGLAARPALHLFMAAPYSFAFFLGRHIKVLRPVTLYEFDFEGERGGGYVSSLTMAAGS